MSTLELIKGGKDKSLVQSKNFIKETIEDSTIEENKVFSRGEVLGLIEQLAKQEDIKPSQLEIIQESYDNDGNLIMLMVKTTEGRALGEGKQSIRYDYMLRGSYVKKSHLGNKHSSNLSRIVRVYNIENPDTFQGGVVAEYNNDKWGLNPGNFGPNVKLSESPDKT